MIHAGYHLPCHTLSAFLRHPPPIIYPSCLSLPPRCCSSSVEGPIYHPPVLSIALLPHATLFSTELVKLSLQFFLVPLPATRLSHYACILPVRLLYLSVCLSASVLLLFCYQGWLSAYIRPMYILFIKVTLISQMCYSPYKPLIVIVIVNTTSYIAPVVASHF